MERVDIPALCLFFKMKMMKIMVLTVNVHRAEKTYADSSAEDLGANLNYRRGCKWRKTIVSVCFVVFLCFMLFFMFHVADHAFVFICTSSSYGFVSVFQHWIPCF